MSYRIAKQVLWAAPDKCPWPKSRSRGAKAAGLRYERAVARALKGWAIHGQWFKFIDKNGPGWCCPDLLARFADSLVVIEVKLTETAAARAQISQLYWPVLGKIAKRPLLGVQIARHLTRNSGNSGNPVFSTLPEALSVASPTLIPTVHWLGFTNLLEDSHGTSTYHRKDPKTAEIRAQ